MVAPLTGPGGRSREGQPVPRRSASTSSGRSRLRPRLLVIAPDQVTFVRNAGGWVLDRVLAGWDVSVLTHGDTDSRPLRILGARIITPDSVREAPQPGAWPETLMIDPALYASDARVRDLVGAAVRGGVREVVWWSPSSSADSDGDTDGGGCSVAHRLSLAARAFKAQALVAAAEPAGVVGTTEILRTGSAGLVPAA